MVDCQDPLSMGFSRQENWSGLPCPSSWDLPDTTMDPCLLRLLCWQAVLHHWASLIAQLVKESACNVGDLGSIPGLGRSPGKGKGYLLWLFWPGEFHGLYSPWGHKESNITEWLSLYLPLAPPGKPNRLHRYRYFSKREYLSLRLNWFSWKLNSEFKPK